MKGKLRANKVKIFAGLLTLILVCTAFFTSKVNYKQTENPITTVDGAYSLTTNDFVSAALKIAREGRAYCCSNYIKGIINDLGGEIVDNGTVCYSIYGTQQKIQFGNQYGDVTLVTSGTKNPGVAWYDAIDNSKLQMGDIVVTTQHTFIYLGYATSYENLKKQVAQQIGGNANDLFKGITLIGGDCNYYTIEGNIASGKTPEGRCPVCLNPRANVPGIRNYTWSSYLTDPGDSYVPNQAVIRVYRISRPANNGYFQMEVSKVDRDTGAKLPGAKYHFEDRNFSPFHVYTDGNVTNSQVKKGNALVTGSNGTVQVPVGGSPNSYTKTLDRVGYYDVCNYSMQESRAPDGYYMESNVNQHFGYKVNTGIVNGEYRVISIDVYFGLWADRHQYEWSRWGYFGPGETMWFTTSGRFVKNDPGASNTVAKFSLDHSANTMKLHTTYYNKKIEGNYHININKKPEGETYDNDQTKKYQTSLANAKFEVWQYKNSPVGLDVLGQHPEYRTAYGKSEGQNDNVLVTREKANTLIKFGGNDEVSINDTSKPDIYLLEETDAPEGTIKEWNHGKIALIVYKKAQKNTNGYSYVIDKVRLVVGVHNYEETAPSSGSAWIRIDKNGNRVYDTNNYAIAYEFNQGAITVTWRNPYEAKGKYTPRVKKVDAKTGKALQGVDFELKTLNQSGESDGRINETKTTGTNGYATFSTMNIDKDNYSEIDKYSLKETYNGDDYYPLRDPILFEVKKEYNEATNKYVVSGIKFDGDSQFKKVISTTAKDTSGRDVPINISLNDNTQEITITAENNETKEYSFYLKKTETNGSTALDNTEFLVNMKEYANESDIPANAPISGGRAVLNGKLSTKANGLIENIDKMSTNVYVYDIHETNAENGYLNYFKKNNQELAFVRLIIKNDESDNLSVSSKIIRTQYCTDEDYEKIEEIVDRETINQSSRSVTLNIKNKKTDISFEFSKLAKGTGSTAELKGGNFKIELDGNEIDSTKLNTDGGFSYRAQKIAVGDHTLRVYELRAPNGFDNIFDKYNGVDGVKVDFSINEDGTKSIKKVTVRGNEYNYTPESVGHVANTDNIENIDKYVYVNMVDYFNKIYVTFYDPVHFDFELYKKLYTGTKSDIAQEDKFNGTATFKITENKPVSAEKFNGTLPTDTQSKFFTEEEATINSTYEYWIEETDVSAGFYRNLVGKKIKVIVSTDANGKVYDESTGRTKYEIYNSDGTQITGNEKKELDEFIKLDVDGNGKINLYIANMPTNYYQVLLQKNDDEGKPYYRRAVFTSVMKSSTSADETRRENIEINPQTAIAQITEGNVLVERGATHTYTLTETTAPAGCKLLKGSIKLDVVQSSQTTGNVIQSATVKYYNESGVETTLPGLDVKYNQGGSSTPVVTVYVPNEGSDFDFELRKVDSTGSLIKASTDSRGKFDGAEFYIGKAEVRANSEATIAPEEAEEFARMISSIGAEVAGTGSFDGILEDGTYSETLPFAENLVYTYVIMEKSAKSGYGKELEGKQINLYVYTRKDNSGKPYIDKVTYAIIDTYNHGQDVTSAYAKYVNATVDDTKTKVSLALTNPNAYKVRLNKTDLAGNPIDTAVIHAYKVNESGSQDLIFGLNKDYNPMSSYNITKSTEISDYIGITKNEEQEWRIYERSVTSPYYNIFGTDKYVSVKVKMDNSGVIKVTGYTVKDNQGREHTELKQYVNEIKIKDENGDKVVDVTFKNPSGYKLKISKYEGDGTTPLEGAVVKLNGTAVISGGSSYYENDYIAGAKTSTTYTITEQSTVANHVNVLEGKEIRLSVYTDEQGNISRSYRILKNGTEVPPTDNAYEYVSVGDVEIVNGIAVIDVKILNPLVGKFNVKLYKCDEDGNLIKKYSARFAGMRSSGKAIMQPINATTSNGVANIDTNAVIKSINDAYFYQISEIDAPLGYEKLTSIISLDTYFKDIGNKLTIDETRTKLQIGSNIIPMSNSDGEFVDNNSQAWYIDNSGEIVTIKIYIKNTEKIFDLALRKYITDVQSEAPNPARNPVVSIPSNFNTDKCTTLKYAHTKEAIKVEAGDIITYRIYVYNEGNVKGYATEITDYLESGLDFVDNDFNRNNGWTATKNNDGTTTVTTRKLENTLLNEFDSSKYTGNNPRWYDYVEIQCKVTRPASTVRSYITDRAEITEDKAVEISSTGDEVEVSIEDRDSQPKNVKQNHEKDMLKYDSSRTYSTDEYYPGYQDDDDKETVYIEKHDFEFVLSKTDGHEEISGAKFKIEELMDNGEFVELYSGTINKNKTIKEPEARGDDTVELYKTYTYKITETATKDSNYKNLLEDKYIIVKTHLTEGMSQGRDQVHKGEYSTPDRYFNTYGYAIYSTSGALISDTDEDGDLYGQIKIYTDNTVRPPQLLISIPNERLYFGSYKINLQKVDTSNNEIEGIGFTINERHKNADSHGNVSISGAHIDAEEDGTINIDKNNVDIVDSFIITEDAPRDGDDEGVDSIDESAVVYKYIRIQNPIVLDVTKGFDATNEKYFVSNIHVGYNGDEEIDIPIANVNGSATRTINLKTADDTTVPATISVAPNGVISIKAQNPPKEGQYKLRLYKVDERNSPIRGIDFTVTGQASTMTTGNDGYTRTISNEITADNYQTVDEYTITETVDSSGRVVGIKNPIKLTVKKKVTLTSYTIESIKLTELNTGVETGETMYAQLDNLAINDDSGRKVSVIASIDNNNLITVKFENPPVEDYINVKIKKVNAKDNSPLNGVTFRAKINRQTSNDVTTGDVGGEHGVAYLDENRKVTSADTFIYEISEIGVPSTPANLLRISDYGWILTLRTKFDESRNRYVIDEDRVSMMVSEIAYNESNPEKRARQKKIAEQVIDSIEVSTDGATLTLTVKNEETTEFGFELRKADLNTNEELSDAKFTIKESYVNEAGSTVSNTLASNQTIADLAASIASKTDILTGKRYVYEIYETTPASKYQNILEKTYIELTIDINNYGNASASYVVKAQSNGTTADVQATNTKIQEYLTRHNLTFIEKNGNHFKLNIPNPKDVVDISLDLLKFETGDQNRKVNNAKFSVRKTTFEDAETGTVDAAVSRFNNNTSVENLDNITTRSNATNWIERTFTATFGEVYYYELTETDVPTNYKRQFYSAIIKVYVDKDGANNVVRASIVKVKLTDTSDWTDYSADANLSVTTDGTTAHVKWANELSYKFRIFKKSYNSVIPQGGPAAITDDVGGANITINNNTNEYTLVDGVIHHVEAYDEGDVHSNTTYEYTIKENQAPTAHYNIFENIDIKLNVRVGANGSLSPNNCSIEVVARPGTVVTQEKLDEARNNVALVVDPATNYVDVYLANKQIHNTYDIKIMKVSDKKEKDPVTGQERDKGISGITFSVMDNSLARIGYGTTGEDGTLTISGIEPNGFSNNYAIAEDTTSARNAGVTPLYGWLQLNADMTGITASMTAEEIEAYLNEKDADGKPTRFSISFLDSRDAGNGATVDIEGRTVIIKIVNRTTDIEFNVSKTDPVGTRISAESIGGEYIPGADFKIVNSRVSPNQTLWDDELSIGGYKHYTHAQANTMYEYTVREKATKVGFINVTKGYDIKVNLKTDNKGVIIEPGENSETGFELIPNGIEEPDYTINEILTNRWVRLSVAYNTETDADTGDEIVVSSIVTLHVINPYEYKLQLNKKDKNGSLPVSAANIKAERVTGADVAKIYNLGSLDDRALVLNQIANATDHTTVVKIDGDPVELDKEPTTISEGYLVDLSNRYALFDTNQTWRISENDVDAPYTNILKDKYIIVNTYFNGELMLARHNYGYDENDPRTSESYNFYVVDKEGNDVTFDYLDYVEVSTAKIDNEWTVVVTVKDPMLMYLSLYKNKGNSSEPLQGANLKIQIRGTDEFAEINNGAYKSEPIVTEFPVGSMIYAEITEQSTVKGFTNVLKDKTLTYVFRNNLNTIQKTYFLVDNTTGRQITGEESNQIMKYIHLEEYTTDEGYIGYRIHVDNPVTFKFDLTKLDISDEPLDGAQIEVKSSHSNKTFYLDGASNMSFIEEDVGPHDVITYDIAEINTSGDPYVNKFRNTVRITVYIQDGNVTISKKEYFGPHGGEFDTMEYFNCYVDPADPSRLREGDLQTLYVELQNPPKIEVELTKTQAGSDSANPVPGVQFKINSIDSHTEFTNAQGKIDYLEEIHEAGDYTIRVYEKYTSFEKYVNVLENKYMQFDINVAADGTITLKNNGAIRFFEDDGDVYFDNDVEITGDEATKLAGYCSIDVDSSSDIKKLLVHIKDPVKMDLKVKKIKTDNSVLEGAKFEITSVEGLMDTIRKDTDANGEIKENVSWIEPGVYEYHVTELNTPNAKFDNVLSGNMIVAYVKVAGNGEITLVADSNGTAFNRNVASNQKYLVKKLDGTAASEDDEARIRKFCKILLANNNLDPDEITFTVENPLNTKLDIIKRQMNIEGQEEALDDTRFTVIKNGNQTLLNNAEVNEQVEIEEHDLRNSRDYYNIYENRTKADGAYVNALEGKYIKVYTDLSADGVLKIVDNNGNDSPNYFEIYNSRGNVLVDRNLDSKLYSYVNVWASANSDGVYVLNVKVVNPITIDVGVIKKQYGEGAQPIPNVDITITSDNTGDHNITSTRSEEVFSEGEIRPGTYNFIIRENNNPNPRYVNVLKDRYAKANVTISKTGDITLNNIKYYTNNNVEIVDPEIKALLQETVYADIDKSSRIQKITFTIENPVTLKFVIHKLDLADNGLESATFNVIKYVGDSNEVAKGMTNVDTNNDGIITFENGDYMKAGIYRYEITELKPAEEKYVNILDCYDDGSRYKVAMYLKLNLDGTTEYVKDGNGTPFANAGRTPYTIINRNDESAAIPEEVTELVHKYLIVEKTASRGNNPDVFDVKVTNTPQIDVDIIKVTKDTDTDEIKTLSGTKFSAAADDGKLLFEDVPATQDKEYTYKNITAGRHEFYLTESQGVVNGGYINVLEDRYVKVYTTIDADGVMKITNSNGEIDDDYFEIYDGQYNHRSSSRILDRSEYADIYECVSVESVRQSNGVYKLNLTVLNPERNYKIVLNKKVFGEEDINMKDVQFFIKGTFDNEPHQLVTDADGNIEFEEKRVPVGVYNYYVTETRASGPEFVNVLEDNYIMVRLQVNQDGSIEIVDLYGETEGNANKYYILDARATEYIDFEDTIVDNFVRVSTNNEADEPELNFFIKDPERYNFKLVKKETMKKTDSEELVKTKPMNNVTFTTSVFGPDGNPATLVDAETFETLDISTIKTDTVDGMDGVVLVPNILIDKTGTYTFVFHEESTDGLFEYLYKSFAEDIKITIDISVETDNQGRPIGYKVGQPTTVTGAKYVDDESTLTTTSKAQTLRAEVNNTPIRGNFDLVLNKLDSYSKARLDGAEFDLRVEKDGAEYALYEDVDDLDTKNEIINHFTVSNGQIAIENIRITPPPFQAPAEDGTLETFDIILTETKAPQGYMLLDDPIVLEVTTAVDGEYDDAKYVVKSVTLKSGENHGLVTMTSSNDSINVVAKNEYFDLALRKSIVSVAYSDSDEAKITEEETEDRIPVIYEDDEIYDLNPSVTTANYRHVKNHVRVYPGQEVIYCLRVYNEGEIDGYAEEITDHLPEGLEFLATDKFNTDRGWTLDLTDQTLRTVKTTFLSKNNNPNNDRFNAENNLIKAMDKDVATGVNHNLDYKEIEIKCRVLDNLRPGVILTNIAEITMSKAEDRTQETVDRDSVVNNADVPDGKDLQNYKEDELTDNREDYVAGQEDDDDFEKLIVVEFDLALRKYITALNDEEILAEEPEEKYIDKVVEDTDDILGEGTASGDAEGTNEGANTNNVNESESGDTNTEGVNTEGTNGEQNQNIDTDEESDEDIDSDNMIKYDREPRVNVSTLKSGDLESIYKDPEEPTTAIYKHTKDPVEVSVDDIVTYTLEVFNEGTVDGYATLIKDDIPEGVEFVPYEEGDGSVNDKYRWKMVDENDEEVTDPKDAKFIVSDYLSKDNETEEEGNLIRAFDPRTGTRLDSKYVQVQFRVICKQDYPKLITNYAQISDDSDESGKEVRDRDSHPNEWIEGEDDQDIERIWVTYMDLALRKFITGVTDFKTGETQVVDTRIPQVDPTALIDETGTTAKYEHTKEPVLVHTNDVVIYTLRIYNEGSKDGYATQIKDDLPEGLIFLPDHEINKEYEWKLVDKNDKPVTRLEDAEFAVTNYLSKDNETEERQNLLKSFDYYDYENDTPAKRETPEYKDIKIAFRVTEPQTSDRIIINEAQISEQTDKKGVHREDRDSTPNVWLGEDDEDIEKIRVLSFDLALRKWVTKAIVTQNGKEEVFETGHHAEDDPEDVVKVDLKKSKINKVVVKFEYQIRITNEGEIDGYAKEIKDRIPEGLRFDPADNPTWTQLEENIIVTDQLKDTLLRPGESAEVTVVLTWINSGDNLGLKVNVAEISKDYNDYGTHDIDSTPDNNVWGEDDIDDAPVMLAVKTGSQVIGYILLAVFVAGVITIGVRRIKKINEG